MERHVFKRWAELTEEERTRNNVLSRAATTWMVEHPGITLTYKTMNHCGLNHFYRWYVEDYNATHQWTKMFIEENGIVVRRLN